MSAENPLLPPDQHQKKRKRNSWSGYES